MLGSLLKWIKKHKKKAVPTYISGYQETPTESGPMEGTASTRWQFNSSPTIMQTNVYEEYNEKTKEVKDTRIEKKPIEVVAEIIREVPVINLVDLKKQIKVVERRERLLEEELNIKPNDEKLALQYLRARLVYKKYESQFKWAVTTNELIDKLLSQYKLRSVAFQGYYKNVPMEAIDELEKFIKAWRNIVKKGEPELRLIIDDGGKEQKKDPILIASSPFGRWWYVLGAWDKEVEYIDDIIYKGK